MKIKKSLLEQIIKEEAMKIKKVMVLKEEKKSIIKQLNELYEETEDSAEEVMQEESILDMIPDAADQEAVKNDMQQGQDSQQTLDEGFGSKIMDSISNILFGKVKQQNPEGFEEFANQVGQKFAGKSYKDIYNTVKGTAKSSLEEYGEQKVTKENILGAIKKIAGNIGVSLGLGAFLSTAASAVMSEIQGDAYGIPQMLGKAALLFVGSAIISGIIYLIANYSKNKTKK